MVGNQPVVTIPRRTSSRLRFSAAPGRHGPASAASSHRDTGLVGGMPVLLAYRCGDLHANGHADDDRLGGADQVMAQ